MNRLGFIHSKLDIKILMLFILSRLPEPVEWETLLELTLCDGGIGYFDYAECLAELVETGHVDENGGKYLITEKGIRNGSAIESSIPYSVREKARQGLMPVAAGMRRDSMIETSHENREKNGCLVSLSMSDGVGEVISIRLLVPGAERAEIIENNFRRNAEEIYNKIIELLG